MYSQALNRFINMKDIQDKTNFLKKEGISIGTIIDNRGQSIGLGSQFRSSNNTTTYLLADPNCRIATAAYECGFSDPDYFAKVFKGKYGQSPSEWRENHLKYGIF